jgi:protoporphyrinogen/coproporphyrinogen III oxidase
MPRRATWGASASGDLVLVAVVGAGPAGCAAAHVLGARGHDVVLIEGEPEIGGRATTLREDGFTIDTGAFYVCNFYRRTLELIEASGHSDALVAMPRETGLFDRDWGHRRWVVGSPGALLRAPGLSPLDRLRVAAVFGIKSLSRLDGYDTEALAHVDSGESVAGWARRAMGERALDRFIRPSFEPWWLFPCENAAASVCQFTIRDAPGMALFAIRGGTDSICDWFASGADVRLGVRASRISAVASGVEVQMADGETIEADACVVATDAPTAAALLAGEPCARRLERVPYAAVAHVSLVYDQDCWGDCPYSTHPARPGEHRAGTVALVAHKLEELVPTGAQVIDVYLNDRTSRAITSSGEAIAIARAEAQEFLGVPVGEPDRAHVFARERAIVMPPPGHYAEMVKAQRELPDRLRLAGDYLSVSVLEGAVRSGERAAVEIGELGGSVRRASAAIEGHS